MTEPPIPTTEDILAFWTPERLDEAENNTLVEDRAVGDQPALGLREAVIAGTTYEAGGAVSDTSIMPWCAIGRVNMIFGTSTVFAGSGVIIGPDTVLTSAHNLFDASRKLVSKAASSDYKLAFDQAFWLAHTITFTPAWKARDSGSTTLISRRFAAVTPPEIMPEYLADTVCQGNFDVAHDLALLTLKPINGVHVGDAGYLPMMTPTDSEPTSTIAVGIPSTASDRTSVRRLESQGGKTWVVRAGVLTKHGALGKGSSGGPWLTRRSDQYWVIGIQSTAARDLTTSSATSFECAAADFVAAHWNNRWVAHQPQPEPVTPLRPPTPPPVNDELRGSVGGTVRPRQAKTAESPAGTGTVEDKIGVVD